MGIDVERPEMRETTALGAAIAAGFATDVWKEFDELKHINRENNTVFSPNTSAAGREKSYTLWKRGVERSRNWLDNDGPETDESDN